jgi:ribosomal protein S18 acetylase RimI-like enzyme
MTDHYTIAIEESSANQDIKLIEVGLHRYNEARCGLAHSQELNVLIRDPDGVIWGGLIGYVSGKRFYIDMLWLDQAIREQGYGSKLIKMAEQEAIAKGCTLAYLDTASFQAPEFYRKLGYEVFGEFQAPGEKFRIIYFHKFLV